MLERKKNGITDFCTECGESLVLSCFEKTCSNCGLVHEEIFSESTYSFDEKFSKGNLNKQYVALGDRTNFVGGLGSFIDYENTRYLRDKSGKILGAKEQNLYKRLKRNYSQFSRIKNHETEYRIFNILNKISIFLNLNKNIQNNAAYYYRKIIKNEMKVINNISLIAFCIFFAVRKEYHNAPVTINEISNAFQNFGHRVNPRLILRDGLVYKQHLTKEATPHKSEDYLVRLVNNVFTHKEIKNRLKKKHIRWSVSDFRIELTKKCCEVLEKLNSWQRGGRNPFILMGAIVYLADKLVAREKNQRAVLTQKIISESTKIAEYSIRDHYVNLLKPIFIKKNK